MKKKKRIFLGYAVFYKGEHFPCSNNVVTRNKEYLRAHALGKLNRIPQYMVGDYLDNTISINRDFKADRKLTLRRVYAE